MRISCADRPLCHYRMRMFWSMTSIVRCFSPRIEIITDIPSSPYQGKHHNTINSLNNTHISLAINLVKRKPG
jgi:hypothetical protein